MYKAIFGSSGKSKGDTPSKQHGYGHRTSAPAVLTKPGTPLGARRPGQACYRGGSLERQTRAGDKVGTI